MILKFDQENKNLVLI